MQTSATNNNFLSIFYGVDFLLTHLAKPEFPRTIATKLTDGKQIIVPTKEEALLSGVKVCAYTYENKPIACGRPVVASPTIITMAKRANTTPIYIIHF